jgi:hypothetical protein
VPRRIEQGHARGRTEREALAGVFHPGGGIEGIGPRRIIWPAVMAAVQPTSRAGDGAAAQMRGAGRERIAEGLPRHRAGYQHRCHHRAGQHEVVGAFQHQHRHRHRRADDRGGQCSHAGQRGRGDVDHRIVRSQVDQAGKQRTDERAHEQRSEEQAAAETEAERHPEARHFIGSSSAIHCSGWAVVRSACIAP